MAVSMGADFIVSQVNMLLIPAILWFEVEQSVDWCCSKYSPPPEKTWPC